jgi:aryl-alcohol dehydrogenase-like predicted oxidoreductase
MIEPRRLGRTGITVSAIGLGTAELGLDYGIPVAGLHRQPGERNAVRFVHEAVDRGVTLFDTAPAYGMSETLLGRALSRHRRQVVVATKVAIPVGTHPTKVAETIQASVEGSLGRLDTDVIDVLQLHSAVLDILGRGDAAAALDRLKERGLVRAIGATTYGEEAAWAALSDGRFDVLQPAINALDRRIETSAILDRSAREDVAILARSVLLRGVLTDRRRHLPRELASLAAGVALLAALADAAGIPLPELAFRYVLMLPAMSSALIGTVRVAELDSAIRAAEAGPLPADVCSAIRGIVVEDVLQLDPRSWPPDQAWESTTTV